ncbi:Zinc finger CCCH domain-containing protein 65 [Zea mays]|uniref:Zinc finger CCCH domain-containing protein 65 n=1 Tax=Zea mays TaxID=4577 RepID=A0A3L6D710_MAIZE|nr:Zinc finger CCCH domain-containing protein 65 [Zea mays]
MPRSPPPSLGGGGDAADADAIEKQLAGLGIAVAGGFPEPSGWDDGPVPVPIPADVLVGGDEGAGEKPRAPAPAPTGAVDVKVRFPRRPGEPDCSYYLKFGTCRFGMKCKFNHPARKKKTSRVRGVGSNGSGSNSSSNKASSPDDDQAPKEEYEGLVPDISDSMVIDMKRGKLEPKEKVCEEPEKAIHFTKLDETNIATQKVWDHVFNPFSNFLALYRPV